MIRIKYFKIAFIKIKNNLKYHQLRQKKKFINLQISLVKIKELIYNNIREQTEKSALK